MGIPISKPDHIVEPREFISYNPYTGIKLGNTVVIKVVVEIQDENNNVDNGLINLSS